MKNKIALESLVMDLKRVAMSLYNNSEKTANIFIQESLKRNKEIDRTKNPKYINKILLKLPNCFKLKDHKDLAEKALTYSVIIQNYTTTNY